ncbi:hypothetical protein PQX77_018877 [Marasmius sp. AFHP31]|nr:hypothetical protein PQX77_018877 [Marasmius sp. AFHP31]
MDNNSSPRSSFSSVRTSIEGMFRNIITSDDRHIISQFLLDVEHEIKGYDAEINRLRTAIHLLETKKLKMKKSMDWCRSLLSPVHRLPTEILMEIFSIACKENELDSSIPPNAINLSSVCGRWWEVIRSAPKMWSSITIPFENWKGRFPALEKLVLLFLDRSVTEPLHLQLHFPGPGFYVLDQDYSSGISSIFRVLHEHAARWQALYLAYPPPTFFFTQHDFPVLRKVELYSLHSTLSDTFFSLFGNAQSLRTFDVCGELLEDFRFDIPFHQIKTLFVRNPYVTAVFASHFARFPALETLYMKGISCDGDPSDQDNTEHHLSKTITSATFEFDIQPALDITFRLLTLPSLTSLEVRGSEGPPYVWPIWEGGAVTDFLSRSSCSITSLFLKNLPITSDQTITLLEHIPTLASLEIEECERMDEELEVEPEVEPLPNRIVTQFFLQRLTVEHKVFRPFRPSHSFLPLLTDITIAMRKDDSVEHGLFNAVASRWIPDPEEAKEIGVKSLKSVAITLLEREGDSDERRWLKSLEYFRDAGLRLRLNL